MKTYIITVTCINNGSLEYNVVDGIYTDKEKAIEDFKQSIMNQASVWGTKPTSFRKVKGYMNQIQLQNEAGTYVKYYTLTAEEAK